MAERDVFYLWHLEHLGVISRASGGWSAPLWDEARSADPVTVAIIDSGLDPLHPNLDTALVAPQIDFGPRVTGAVYRSAGSAVAALRRAMAAGHGDLKAIVGRVLAEVSDHAAGAGLDIAQLRVLHDTVHSAGDPTPAARAFLDALSVRPVDTASVDPAFGDTAARIHDLDLTHDQTTAVTAIVEQMAAGYVPIDMPDPAQYFGAHATACAGLVGGRPPQDQDHAFFGALPYYGVNPFCRIASYATPYSHEIRPVINALLAAYLSGAAVILMPRGLPDVAARRALPPSARRGTRIETSDAVHPVKLVAEDQANLAALERDRDLAEALLLAIAKRRYLVLAAGNEGHATALAYPASAGGLADRAIVVAAVTRDGLRASYSNGAHDPATVMHMVSDDAEVLHRDDQRIDAHSLTGSDFRFGPVDLSSANARYVPWAPLSLDVRGPYGFAASSQRDVPDFADGVDVASLYTLFGGTSAAASQAAGVISLLIQAGKLPAMPTSGIQPVIAAMHAQDLHHALPVT